MVWKKAAVCEKEYCVTSSNSLWRRQLSFPKDKLEFKIFFLTLQLSTLQLLLESAPNWHLQPQAQTALIHISWVNHYVFSHRVSKPGTGTSWKVSFPSSNKSLFNSYTTIKEQVMHNNNNIYISVISDFLICGESSTLLSFKWNSSTDRSLTFAWGH